MNKKSYNPPPADIDEDVVLSAIGEGSSEGITRIDATGRILTWSAGATRILGYKREEIIGKSINMIVPEDDLEKAYESIRRQISGEVGVIHEETRRLSKSGELIPIVLTRLPLTNQEGKIVALLAILKDISQQKKLESQVEFLERNVAMAKVAAKVAHEIRTPLGVLFLKSDLLLERICQTFENWGQGDGTQYRKPVEKCITDIQRQISRLEEIANNYLHLSKTRTMEREQIQLPSFVRDIMNEVREQYPDSNISFEHHIDEDIPPAMLDSQQFQRVFMNLIRNSVEALRSSNIKEGFIKLEVKNQGDHLQLVIADNGPGMPEKIKKAAFDPFTTSKSIGTGLGLYLVKEIVENHEGQINIDSSPEKGTTIQITVPYNSKKE